MITGRRIQRKRIWRGFMLYHGMCVTASGCLAPAHIHPSSGRGVSCGSLPLPLLNRNITLS